MKNYKKGIFKISDNPTIEIGESLKPTYKEMEEWSYEWVNFI
ncbi:hypothetical protein [Oceanobacillus senegalensis]|nr:hypothetical protein [Oceanobacillus senegalensis]